MCNIDKIVKMIDTGQTSTPSLYLALIKQTPEEFKEMRQGLEARQITFTVRPRVEPNPDNFDLYLVTENGESMALVAQNSTPEWLQERGFSLV